MSERAFILGLDGVPWDLIDQWTESGDLPNFARLREEGSTGPLESTMPAATPMAWPSISTGVRPDKHGIYGFQNLTSKYSHELNTSSRLEYPPIWRSLSNAIVVNVPMTYPATDIDGTMVSGIMSPTIDEQYTHPSSLAEEIETEIPEYEIALRWHEYIDDPDGLVEDISTQIEARRQLLTKLMDRDDWELFFFTFMEPDRLQHLVWDEDVLREIYSRLDDILGMVMDYVDEHDANLFVVSDHGFGPISKGVGVNRILEDAGYLERAEASGAQGALDTLGVNKSSVTNFLERIGVNHRLLIKKYLPQSVVDFAASNVPGDHWIFDLDHENTTAFVHEFGMVYINDSERFADGTVAPEDVPEVKRELTELFEDVTDPETGVQMLTVHDGDDCFPTDDRSPDLVLEPGDRYEIIKGLDAERVQEPNGNAGHRPDGIFLAWGNDIDSGTHVTDASVLDVAPTVLHSLERPISEAVDGDVLAEVFDPAAAPANHEVDRTKLEDSEAATQETGDMDDVKDRLQGLGYLS